MSDPNNIDLAMRVSGADEAVKEIEKVEEKLDEVSNAVSPTAAPKANGESPSDLVDAAAGGAANAGQKVDDLKGKLTSLFSEVKTASEGGGGISAILGNPAVIERALPLLSSFATTVLPALAVGMAAFKVQTAGTAEAMERLNDIDMDKLAAASPALAQSVNEYRVALERAQTPWGVLVGAIKDGWTSVSDEAEDYMATVQEALFGQSVRDANKAAMDSLHNNSVAYEKESARQKAAIDSVTAAVGHQIDMLKQAQGLQETKAAGQDAQALRSGVDPNLVAANAAVRESGSKILELANEIIVQNGEVEKAQKEQKGVSTRLGELRQDLVTIENSTASNAEKGRQTASKQHQIDEALVEQNNAQIKTSAEQQKLKNLQEKNSAAVTNIIEEGSNKINESKAEAAKAYAAAGEAAIKAAQGSEAAMKGVVAGGIQKQIEALNNLMKDGVDDALQGGDFKAAIDRMKTALSGRDNQASAALAEIESKLEASQQTVKDIEAKYAENQKLMAEGQAVMVKAMETQTASMISAMNSMTSSFGAAVTQVTDLKGYVDAKVAELNRGSR